MVNFLKKMVLWVNNHRTLAFLLILTMFIPLGISALMNDWGITGVFLVILGTIAVVYWVAILIVAILILLKNCWEKIVEWAENE
jgi:hypothetical protein